MGQQNGCPGWAVGQRLFYRSIILTILSTGSEVVQASQHQPWVNLRRAVSEHRKATLVNSPHSNNGCRQDAMNTRLLGKKLTGLAKTPTGIHGLDEMTNGGLPKGRPTLICGVAGCGKTLLAMEFMVRGAREFNESGVFMAFEETGKELSDCPPIYRGLANAPPCEELIRCCRWLRR
jgi:KaiC